MQAYVDGKSVQYRHRDDSNWALFSDPGWDWGRFVYRIAPEPAYRPYNSPSEVPIGAKVRHKPSGTVHMIWDAKTQGMIPVTVWVDVMCPIGSGTHQASEFLANFEFLDGKPCGVLEGGAK